MIQASKIAVIIPHYNDHDRLRRCLSALAKNDLTAAEVVVVDNASPTPVEPITQEFPQVRLVTEPLKGAAAARNRGAAETTAPTLAFLDADCVPAPDWLTTANALAADNTVIGGRIDVFDETPAPRSGAEAFETVFAFHQRSYVEDKGFSVTANLVTTRSVFDRTGPLIVGVSEDLEWCQRATAKGARLVYADTLKVSHPTRIDWPALRKKWLRTTQEAFQLQPANAAGRLKWVLRAAAMPLSIAAHTPKVLRHPALRGATERRAALATLARLRLTRAAWMLRQSLGIPL
ncbi:glycosyltransferase family 2 protein [Actibacterium sp. 188UL27-1]|uniref:glycosyltransferase family 2 protein n=1 Tax=Actibacterium sp. 188UL27-1 TaxID=2786961 RepID=UPI00195C747B|nr:glycosyltransferase [Actibacterium sp. 188UL27-1]MBM7068989.1 glycosyltransferase [Actibacterium sp. 188UL27-1]